jgi:tetraacyldisaccharide 4'-kinase
MNPPDHNARLVRFLLLPFAYLFGMVVWVRNTLFDHGWIKACRFPVPVVSVGNLTAGGTGKTPFVIWLAENLMSGYGRIAVISRGYGRRSKGVRIVSDGEDLVADPATGGDEPVLTARRLKGVPVIVAEKRGEGIRRAIDVFKPDLILLDDGFQHRYVARDCDIVLVDRRRIYADEHLLPAGSLREPLRNISRASFVVYTHSGGSDKNLPVERFYKGPVAHTRHTPAFFVDRHLDFYGDLDVLKGKRVAAFAGIAEPVNFRNMLDGLGIKIAQFESLPDHYYFEAEWIDRFLTDAALDGCRFIVTTEKDIIKLSQSGIEGMTILALRIEISVDDPEKLIKSIKTYIDKGGIHL